MAGKQTLEQKYLKWLNTLPPTERDELIAKAIQARGLSMFGEQIGNFHVHKYARSLDGATCLLVAGTPHEPEFLLVRKGDGSTTKLTPPEGFGKSPPSAGYDKNFFDTARREAMEETGIGLDVLASVMPKLVETTIWIMQQPAVGERKMITGAVGLNFIGKERPQIDPTAIDKNEKITEAFYVKFKDIHVDNAKIQYTEEGRLRLHTQDGAPNCTINGKKENLNLYSLSAAIEFVQTTQHPGENFDVETLKKYLGGFSLAV